MLDGATDEVPDLAAALHASSGDAAARHTYEHEVLAHDLISGHWRVVHEPRVAVRQFPSIEASCLGMRRAGEVVATSEQKGNWVRIAARTGAREAGWMLTHGKGTIVEHLGFLLQPIALPEVTTTPLKDGATTLVASAQREPHTCDSTRVAALVAGGLDGGEGGAWRVLMGGPDGRWGRAAAASGKAIDASPSAKDFAAMSTPVSYTHLTLPTICSV